MAHPSFRRLTTTFAVVLSLLFSQLALADYVCPARADASAMAAMMAAGAPCDGMDPAQPVLCHQQSAAAAQTFEAAELPVASLPRVVHVVVLPPAVDPVDAQALPAMSGIDTGPPPDPLFLSTLRLRV